MDTIDFNALLQGLPASAIVLLFVVYLLVKQKRDKKNGPNNSPTICPMDKSGFLLKMGMMAEHQKEVRDDVRETNRLMQRLVTAQENQTSMLKKVCEKNT